MVNVFKSLFIFTFLFTTAMFSQTIDKSLDETLGTLSADAGKAYVSPIVSGFGANLNSGWIHKAPSSKLLGLDIELGIVAMGTIFNDDNKSFSTSGTFRFDRPQAQELTKNIANVAARNYIIDEIIKTDFTVTVSGPTIVGKKADSVKVGFPGKTYTYNSQNFTVPGQNISTGAVGFLEDAPALPLAAPQLSIGTVYGTSVSLRYIPSIKIDADLGEFKYMGFGIQHNPGIWFPNPLPVNLSVGFFTQSMDVGTVFSSKATTFGLYASKTFGPSFLSITPYAGFALESSTISVKYDYILDDVPVAGQQTKIPVAIDLEGENSSRIIVGFALRLGIINISADYNMAKYNVASAGLSFIF